MGVGIDIVEVDKIKKLTERWGKKFLTRIFTDEELEEWKSSGERMDYLAGRFATKEAFMKASAKKITSWKDIEVISVPFSSPIIRLHQSSSSACVLPTIELSISHTNQFAVAVVIIK